MFLHPLNFTGTVVPIKWFCALIFCLSVNVAVRVEFCLSVCEYEGCIPGVSWMIVQLFCVSVSQYEGCVQGVSWMIVQLFCVYVSQYKGYIQGVIWMIVQLLCVCVSL
jgi:hypothetical protein